MNRVMINFLAAVFIVSLVVTFLYILLSKWGVWEYLQVHADDWVSTITHKESDLLNRLFSCTFCTTWWTSVILCLFLLIFTGEWSFLLVPFCSTPISRHLI